MNEIKIFSNDSFGDVRVTAVNNIPMFCLSDICKVLEIKNVSDCKSRLSQKGIVTTDTLTNGGIQSMVFISEANLYKCIFQSRKPDAEIFQDWVCEEVLPSIRHNGGYIANQERLTPEQIVANALIVAQNIINNQNKVIEDMGIKMSSLEKKSDYLDLILESKETITVTQLAADYGMSAKAMNKILSKLGVQHKVNKQWILYAKYLGEGYVHSKTVVITRSNGMKDTVMNTEWKQRGRLFLYNLLKENGILPLIEQ